MPSGLGEAPNSADFRGFTACFARRDCRTRRDAGGVGDITLFDLGLGRIDRAPISGGYTLRVIILHAMK
jgi:hypothetical protein